MITLEKGLLYSEFLVRPQCGAVQVNDSGTILIFGGDEMSASPNQNTASKTPNSFVLQLKSENETLHFVASLSKQPVEVFNIPIGGIAYPHSNKVFAVSALQRQSQKLLTLNNGQWVNSQ